MSTLQAEEFNEDIVFNVDTMVEVIEEALQNLLDHAIEFKELEMDIIEQGITFDQIDYDDFLVMCHQAAGVLNKTIDIDTIELFLLTNELYDQFDIMYDPKILKDETNPDLMDFKCSVNYDPYGQCAIRIDLI